nr:hypothetical protein [uncultured Alcanivorax sp.]
MLPEQNDLTESSVWLQLESLAREEGSLHLSDFFVQEPGRCAHFCLESDGLLVDLSKQRVSSHARDLLVSLADERGLDCWREALFSGAEVNCTEHRSAKHWLLRDPSDQAAEVHAQLEIMDSIVSRVLEGQWRGVLGDAITDVVNVGVGGSELGPLMAAFALNSAPLAEGEVRPSLHFASSMDGSQISQVLQELNPRTTLVLVSSKSFTTVDTLHNANTARSWMARALELEMDNEAMLRCHFIGISAQPDKMSAWGIPSANQLQLSLIHI